MLNTSLRAYKHHVKRLLPAKNLITQSKLPEQYSCLCGHVYLKPDRTHLKSDFKMRVHSTQSDQHRQKVVLETSTPNVIDKLRYEKMLPLKEDKVLWIDKIDPYFKLARWDKPIALVITYPLAKRFTNYPQVFLGATFNWGALLGYSAITVSLKDLT
ncbi:UbiA prenyltransferase domain-containing protein, partial [Operophtera brumata]